MKRKSFYFKWSGILLVLLFGRIGSLQAANVLLSWSANTESDLAGYKVYYRTSSGNYGTPINVGNVTSYTLTGLNAGTFFFAAKAYDTSGNESGFSTEVSLTVTTPDTTPPVISAVLSTNVTKISATITWTTNEPGDSQVDYGITTAYGSSTSVNASQITAHSQTLNGLTPGTVYNFRVRSRDGAGNVATSGNFTFTTAPSTGCDVNGDGGANALDLQAVINAILSANNSASYDINRDGVVNVLDLQLLSNVILGVGLCP